MSGLPETGIGSNPPEPRSRENGDRKGGANPELVEHRLNQLEGSTQKIEKDISDLRVSVGKIEEGMKHVATRAWVLGGVIGGMTIAVAIAGAILRFWPVVSSSGGG